MHVLAQATETVNLPAIEWRAIAPELALVVAGVVLLFVVAWYPDARRPLLAGLTLVGLAVAAGLTAWNWHRAGTAFGGAVSFDGITRYARLILLCVGALTALVAASDRDPLLQPEIFPLMLFALTGMILLAAASDLLVVFITLEILSLSLYIMAGSNRRSGGQEAAMKYFLLGAFSSAFLLYGIALIYGATSTTSLAGIARATGDPTLPQALLFAGVALLAVGFCFKVAAVPFHMWTPDVYQGAPTPVTAFMAAGTKAAGFAVFLRVFAGALGGLVLSWRPAIATVAVATMLVGAVLAIVQTDLKRMLAYSSIAHAGYLFIGVIAAATVPGGLSASMFYLLAYAFTVMGSFMVVEYASRVGGRVRAAAEAGQREPVLAPAAASMGPGAAAGAGPGAAGPGAAGIGPGARAAGSQPDGTATPARDAPAGPADDDYRERSSLQDYRGLGRTHPWVAALLALFMFSLAGIPLTSGFWGKYFLFQAGVDARITWLVVVGVIASVISAFFYLRVVVVTFLQNPVEATPATPASPALGLALAAAAAMTIVLSFVPGPFLDAAAAATRILG